MREILTTFISLVYSLSLFYYTFYGVFKSGSEYFCFEGRADNSDYNAEYSVRFINFTDKLINCDNCIALSFGTKIGLYKDTKKNFTFYDDLMEDNYTAPLYERVSVGKMGVSVSYNLNNEYFKVDCYNKGKLSNLQDQAFETYDPGRNINGIDNNYTLISFMDKMFSINQFGYLTEEISMFFVDNEIKGEKRTTMTCEINKSPKTCDLNVSTTNRFFVGYITLIILLTINVLIINCNYKRYGYKRLISYFISIFETNYSFIDFCNPMTGKSLKMIKGTNCIHLTEGYTLPLSENRLYKIKDRAGKYLITNDNLLIIKIKEKTEVILISNDCKNLIASYFFEIYISNQMCACDNTNSHFLKTSDVINHLVLGGGLEVVEVMSDSYVLDVKMFEFNYLFKKYEIKKALLMQLLEHNWNFFERGYNLNALEYCIKGKTWCSNRPDNIKNSQWKIYLSDFSRIMKLNERPELKGIKTFGETKALKDMKESLDSGLAFSCENEVLQIDGKIIEKTNTSVILKQAASKLAVSSRPKFFTKPYDNEPEYLKESFNILNDCRELSNPDLDFNNFIRNDNLKESISNIKKEYENRLEKVNKMVIDNKDVLTKCISEKIAPKIRTPRWKTVPSSSRNRAKKEEKKEEENTEPQKPETVKNIHPILGRFINEYREDFAAPLIKIKLFDKILNCLDEYENELEKEKEKDLADFNVIKINKNEIIEKCLNCKLVKRNTKVKKKKNRKSTRETLIKFNHKGSDKTAKRCFISRDFDFNLSCAMKFLLNNKIFDEKEKKDFTNMRCKTTIELAKITLKTVKERLKNDKENKMKLIYRGSSIKAYQDVMENIKSQKELLSVLNILDIL